MSKKIKVLYGSTVKYTVSAPYYVTKTGTINSVTENTSEEVTLARVTDKFMVTLSVDPTGAGSITGAESGQYLAGTTLVLTHTDTVGYTFDGWYVNGEKKWTDNPYNFVVDQESTIVAKYNRDTVYYQITVNAEPQNAGNPTGEGQYEEGTTATLSSNPAEGYRFSQWQDGNTSDPREVLVTSDKTYTANYVKTYTITKDSSTVNGTIEITPENNTYDAGAEVSIEAIPSNHYHFVSWTGTISGNVSPYSLIVNRDHTIGAVFTEDTKYNVQVSTGGNGTAIIEGGYSSKSYYSGEYCTVIANANTGYHFVSWTSGSTVVSNNASYNFEVTSDITLTANFAKDTAYYNISLSANNSNYGTVSGGGSKAEGSNITVTATANNGYTFVNWTENGSQVSTNASYSFTVTGDRTLVANFTQNVYTITVNANPSEGGTVSGGGNNFTYNQPCTVTATPTGLYTFVNWTENGSQVSTDASYGFNVTGNRNLVANFKAPDQKTISVTIIPENSGTVSGGGTHTIGESVNLSATANPDYTFVNWSGDIQGTDNPYPSFNMPSNDMNITANFTKDTYTITVSPSIAHGTVTTNPSGSSAWGEDITVTVTPDQDYQLDRLYYVDTTEHDITNGKFEMPRANVTVYAVFSQIPAENVELTLSVNPANTGSVTVNGRTYSGTVNIPVNTPCAISAEANTGYHFINWTDHTTSAQVSTNNPYTFTPDGSEDSIHYDANFALNEYSAYVNITPQNAGDVTITVSPIGQNLTINSVITLTAHNSAAYKFDGWTDIPGEASEQLDSDVISIDGDVAFAEHAHGDRVCVGTANFVLKEFTIIYDVDNPGINYNTPIYNVLNDTDNNVRFMTDIYWDSEYIWSKDNGDSGPIIPDYVNYFLIEDSPYITWDSASPIETVVYKNHNMLKVNSDFYRTDSYTSAINLNFGMVKLAADATLTTYIPVYDDYIFESDDPNIIILLPQGPSTHYVSASVSPSNSGTIIVTNDQGIQASEFAVGDTVTVTTTANSGYVFDEWGYPSGLTVITAGSGGGNGTAGGSGTGTGNTSTPSGDGAGSGTSTGTGSGDGAGSGTSTGTGSGSSSNTSAVLQFTMPNNDVTVTAYFVTTRLQWMLSSSEVNAVDYGIAEDPLYNLSIRYTEGSQYTDISIFDAYDYLRNEHSDRNVTYMYKDISDQHIHIIGYNAGATELSYSYNGLTAYLTCNVNPEVQIYGSNSIGSSENATQLTAKLAYTVQGEPFIPNFTTYITNYSSWSVNPANFVTINNGAVMRNNNVGDCTISISYAYTGNYLSCTAEANHSLHVYEYINYGSIRFEPDFDPIDPIEAGSTIPSELSIIWSYNGNDINITDYCNDPSARYVVGNNRPVNGIQWSSRVSPGKKGFTLDERQMSSDFTDLQNGFMLNVSYDNNGQISPALTTNINIMYTLGESGSNPTITIEYYDNTIAKDINISSISYTNVSDLTDTDDFIENAGIYSAELTAGEEYEITIYSTSMGNNPYNIDVETGDGISVTMNGPSFNTGVLDGSPITFTVTFTDYDSEIEEESNPEESPETPVEPTPEPEPSPEEETSSGESPEES